MTLGECIILVLPGDDWCDSAFNRSEHNAGHTEQGLARRKK